MSTVLVTPEVMALAEAHAARDRDTLARLLRAGDVRRDSSRPSAFTRDVDARAFPRRQVNLAIRPKKGRSR